MAGQEIKDELYWKAARTYILYKYRKTIMAIGFGLALLTAGGVYYYIKRREVSSVCFSTGCLLRLTTGPHFPKNQIELAGRIETLF